MMSFYHMSDSVKHIRSHKRMCKLKKVHVLQATQPHFGKCDILSKPTKPTEPTVIPPSTQRFSGDLKRGLKLSICCLQR